MRICVKPDWFVVARFSVIVLSLGRFLLIVHPFGRGFDR